LSNVVLSIAVPTFNRAQLLDGLLRSIVQEITSWPSDLELIVSDNASTDGTNDVVIDFIQRGYPIRFLRNETNIGPEDNFGRCFDSATGKYFWMIGDDEVMYRGTVAYVLGLCRSREFGLLHLTSRWFSHGQQSLIASLEMPSKFDLVRLNAKALFRRANVYLTFISANIINRQAVLVHVPDFDSKAEFNTSFPQLAWTFNALNAVDGHLYIGTPVFGALGGNTSGYQLIQVFGHQLSSMTQKYCARDIPQSKAIMEHAAITRVIAGEIWLARQGSNSSAQVRKLSQFQPEDTLTAADRAFGEDRIYRWLLKPIINGTDLQSKVAWFATRIFNKLNVMLNFRFL